MNNLQLILDIYLFFSFFIIVLVIFLFTYTKKYSQKKVKVLGLFLDLSKSDCMIIATNLFHFLLSIYCVFNIDNFNTLISIMFIVNSVINVFLCFNFHLIIAETIYTSITLFVLILLNLVNTFLTNIKYDTMTYVLSLVFMSTIVVFLLFACVRKLELVLKKNKHVRRNI